MRVEEWVVHLLQIARKDNLCALAASRNDRLDIDRPQLLRFVDDKVTPGQRPAPVKLERELAKLLYACLRVEETDVMEKVQAIMRLANVLYHPGKTLKPSRVFFSAFYRLPAVCISLKKNYL